VRRSEHQSGATVRVSRMRAPPDERSVRQRHRRPAIAARLDAIFGRTKPSANEIERRPARPFLGSAMRRGTFHDIGDAGSVLSGRSRRPSGAGREAAFAHFDALTAPIGEEA
jgi:hypothetical protein